MTSMKRQTFLRAVALGTLGAPILAACASETVAEKAARENGPGDATAAADDFSSIIPEGDIVEESTKIVEASLEGTTGFTPADSGPAAQQPGAKIAFVGSDMTNGGTSAVSQGVKEATDAMGWTLDVYDGKATAQGRSDAMQQAIASMPAAIVVGGFDPTEQQTVIKQAETAKIPVLGWHAGPDAGPGNGLVTNVTTDALTVAQLAAAYVVSSSKGKAGVAIFTDGQYDIAVLKANAMQAYVKAAPESAVLRYEDSPIAEADQRMPGLISSLLQSEGDKLTHLMAINGNYFGGAQQALRAAGKKGDGAPHSVAAGDGDAAEFQRIRTRDYQAATVAEPLLLQGWQVVDEINRALAGEKPSDFIPQPGLITIDNVPEGDVFDPDSGYREVYKKVWGVS